MARQESEGFRLHATHEYTFPHKSPSFVTGETAHCLHLLQIDIADKAPAREFLSTYTSEFLEGVERGFLSKYMAFAAKRNVDMSDLDYFAALAERVRPADAEDMEAFNFSLVNFCAMPEYAESEYLPNGFSRRGVVAPPFALSEIYGRIQELRDVNTYLASGGEGVFDMREPAMLRYMLYHDVGRSLPLRSDTPEKDVQRKSDEAFMKMMDGVDVDL